MKQLVQSYRTGALRLEEAPVPALRPAGLLVRNAFSLISPGTERAQRELARASLLTKARRRPEHVRQVLRSLRQEGWRTTFRKVFDRLDTPVAVGYCSAGTVLEASREVSGFALGDRIACAGEGHGAHAEVVYVPRTLCAHVPENVPLEHAAVAPLGAIALESLRMASVQLGERVAVLGLGMVGLLVVQLLEAAGCHVLAADFDPERINRARELGAAAACEVEHLEIAAGDFTRGRGVDAVLLTATSDRNEPVEWAGRIARERGRVVAVGAFPLEIPRRTYYEKELTFTVSRAFGPGTYDPDYLERGRDYPYSYARWTAGRHLEEFLAQLARGRVRVEPLLTHRFPIERAPDAYRLLEDRDAHPLGILFSYQADKPLSHAPVHLTPAPRPLTGKQALRVGVVGAGKFAQTYLLPHLRNRGVELAAVATASAPSAAQVARKFGFQQATCDAEAVIDDPGIHCVLIATRHDLHARLAARALRAGKTVFLEKPVALDEQGLRQVLAAAQESGARLLVGFNRRFSPLTQRLRQFFAQRQGPLVMTCRVNAAPLPAGHWIYDPAEGGGRIRSEVCHFVDLLQCFAGARPVRVSAEPIASPGAGLKADENVHITLQFADGSVGNITYTTLGDSSLSRERLEVFGDQAVAQINNFRSTRLHRHHHSRRYWLFQPDLGYRNEINAFLDAAQTGQPMPVSLREIAASSLATLKILEALARRTPVEINLASLGLLDA